MSQDLDTYTKKAVTYLGAYKRAAEEAANDDNQNQTSGVTTLNIGDPQHFWIKQVLNKFIVC